MKRKFATLISLVACVLFCVLGLTGCGLFGNNGNGDEELLKGLSFNESNVSLTIGDTFQLKIDYVWMTREEMETFRELESEDFNDGEMSFEEYLVSVANQRAEWGSENSDIVTVYKDGTITALNAGSTSIHVTTFIASEIEGECNVTVYPAKDSNEDNDPDDVEKPNDPFTPVIEEVVYEFYDITSDDYPYNIENIKVSMMGNTMTFKSDGSVVMKGNGYTTSATYVKSADKITVTSAGGATVDYIINGDVISNSYTMALVNGTYHMTQYFMLKGDEEEHYEELADRSFAFYTANSTSMDSSALASIRSGYKNAVLTFSDDGTFDLYNPSDSIDTDANSYSRQRGRFTCFNGEGKMYVTSATSGGSSIIGFVPFTYVINFDGNKLTLNQGDLTLIFNLTE